jgi:hypothetical protein
VCVCRSQMTGARACLKGFCCGEDTYLLYAMAEGLVEYVCVLLRLPHADHLARPPLGCPSYGRERGRPPPAFWEGGGRISARKGRRRARVRGGINIHDILGGSVMRYGGGGQWRIRCSSSSCIGRRRYWHAPDPFPVES